VARAGVINRGIALDRCTVAGLLNSGRDWAGADGLAEETARADRKVLETARDAVVLNADDPLGLALSGEFPIDRTILFSLDPAASALGAHAAAGGTLVTLQGDGDGDRLVIVLGTGGRYLPVLDAAAIPATSGGRDQRTLANVLAAVALAHGMKVPFKAISAGLSGFRG
jgi:cyanophycin synthetase